ncbi:MAG TPA: CRISPR system precrRNA processing endoribonuclease RAMP protein Cas6 [Ktedonobacteraceae bacterium]|nr:CRISPR system precrRNA processing endoribonuclease RAMP protein Cas6 [Ktedonobacteraceae bacterium]
MELLQNPTANPTKLYALFLKLRPLQQGTLMPFSGEMVHGAFLRWLRAAAPDVADWLHDGQKRRLFTCSSLHFSRPMHTSLRAERENIHLPLDPRRTYTVRLTLLMGDLFPLFHQALMQFNSAEVKGHKPPFMQLGKQLFLLEEVVLANDEPSGWTGFTSLTNLIEKAHQQPMGSNAFFTLEFASLTTFSRGSNKTGYGTYQVMFPQPEYVFHNLMRRWEDVAPPELAPLIQKERLEQYLLEDGMIVIDYDLTAHHVHFTTHRQRGFIGTCTYQLRGPNEQPTPEAPLTVKQQFYLLAQLAFYTSVGYKTAMGLGQVRLKTERTEH